MQSVPSRAPVRKRPFPSYMRFAFIGDRVYPTRCHGAGVVDADHAARLARKSRITMREIWLNSVDTDNAGAEVAHA